MLERCKSAVLQAKSSYTVAFVGIDVSGAQILIHRGKCSL